MAPVVFRSYTARKSSDGVEASVSKGEVVLMLRCQGKWVLILRIDGSKGWVPNWVFGIDA